GAPQDLFIQLRADGRPDFLCARIPAADLVHRGGREFFKRPKRGVEMAHGIDALVIKQRKNGSVVLKAKAKRASFELPPAGTLDVTIGLRDPAAGEAGNRCATTAAPFTRGKKGALEYP